MEKEAYEKLERNEGKDSKGKAIHTSVRLTDDVFKQIEEEEKEKDK